MKEKHKNKLWNYNSGLYNGFLNKKIQIADIYDPN